MSASVPLPLVEGKSVEENSTTEPIETREKVDETVELIEIADAESQKEETSASSSAESLNEDAKTSDQVEEKNVPGTSQGPIEEVDSKRSTKRAKSTARIASLRPLLKRRGSRVTIPRRNVTEETDSATPRTSNKRSTKKRRIALFLESDYPRKK